jgi:hypothetical protein
MSQTTFLRLSSIADLAVFSHFVTMELVADLSAEQIVKVSGNKLKNDDSI